MSNKYHMLSTARDPPTYFYFFNFFFPFWGGFFWFFLLDAHKFDFLFISGVPQVVQRPNGEGC